MKSPSDIKLDPQDQALLEQHHFSLKRKRGKWYAETCIDGRTVGIHRLILGVERDSGAILVDHVDRDGLNNRRANLRRATRSQNGVNIAPRPGCSSRYKGVDFHNGRWRARTQGKHLGHFKTERQAAIAYDHEVLARFGEFAVTNVVHYRTWVRKQKAA